MHTTQPRTGQLRTSQLGGTGLEITRVGFGAWAMGGGGWQFGWGPQQDEEPREAEQSLELGVPLPWATTADAQLTDAEQRGYAHRDFAALFQVLARRPAPPHTTTADRPASTPAVPAAGHGSTS